MDWKSIKAITFDVDGVMTDGSLLAFDNHDMVRVFNAKDSFAVRVAVMRGIKVGVFTGGNTEGVRNRLITCDIPAGNIYMGCRGKLADFREFCANNGVAPSEVVYIGDDVADVQLIKAAGIGAVPADGAIDAVEAADYHCHAAGGKGCVREIIELVLRAKGLWNFGEEDYKRIF